MSHEFSYIIEFMVTEEVGTESAS
ncbi:hypothetical protein VCHA51O444_10489 [Vibrio chagasii]|nr:hypothetical protein VCHA51O444_10489 [Vibrio chagasii]CAH7346547.1 hypothetical protein VCHA53O474_30297 [Vibrio chagasii]